jgi:hypothetical protein
VLYLISYFTFNYISSFEESLNKVINNYTRIHHENVILLCIFMKSIQSSTSNMNSFKRLLYLIKLSYLLSSSYQSICKDEQRLYHSRMQYETRRVFCHKTCLPKQGLVLIAPVIFWSKFRQQFDLCKPDIFLFIALVAILCSELKRAGHMHN